MRNTCFLFFFFSNIIIRVYYIVYYERDYNFMRVSREKKKNSIWGRERREIQWILSTIRAVLRRTVCSRAPVPRQFPMYDSSNSRTSREFSLRYPFLINISFDFPFVLLRWFFFPEAQIIHSTLLVRASVLSSIISFRLGG